MDDSLSDEEDESKSKSKINDDMNCLSGTGKVNEKGFYDTYGTKHVNTQGSPEREKGKTEYLKYTDIKIKNDLDTRNTKTVMEKYTNEPLLQSKNKANLLSGQVGMNTTKHGWLREKSHEHLGGGKTGPNFYRSNNFLINRQLKSRSNLYGEGKSGGLLRAGSTQHSKLGQMYIVETASS